MRQAAMRMPMIRTFKSITLLVMLMTAFVDHAVAADSFWEMEPMEPNLDDKESLQRGAGLFTNFCMGCHSLKYQRYERTADDLGPIPHDLVVENLIFTDQKIGGHMETSMSQEDAKAWFGAPPPDLTMVTRVRSPEWVYNFLKTFYADDTTPFGVNNKVFPHVGMPHALLMLQGINDEVCVGKQPVDILTGLQGITAERVENCPELKLRAGTGIYSPEEFDRAAFDIANFLHYVGDPTRQEREALGGWVIGFLIVLLILAFFLNRNYWQDVKGNP